MILESVKSVTKVASILILPFLLCQFSNIFIFSIYCALQLFNLEFHVTHFDATPTRGLLTIPVDLAQINAFDI